MDLGSSLTAELMFILLCINGICLLSLGGMKFWRWSDRRSFTQFLAFSAPSTLDDSFILSNDYVYSLVSLLYIVMIPTLADVYNLRPC